MRTFRLIILLGVCLLGAYLKYGFINQAPRPIPADHEAESNGAAVTAFGVPEKATQVLHVVRTTGQAPEGYVGGRVFQNREGRLPADGEYREFDIDPHAGGRNAERIIVEWNTKKAWYTGDHYQTFVPLP